MKNQHWKSCRCLFAFGITFLLVSTSSLASSFSSIPTADAFVTSGPSGNLANNNYGGTGSISVSAPGLGQGEFQSALQFDLAPAASAFNAEFGAGNWSVQSVTLQLTATTAGNPIFNTSAAGNVRLSWMQNDSWLEGTGSPTVPGNTGITFATLPNFIGANDEVLGTFGYNGVTSGANSYALNLTPLFQGDVTSGSLVSLRLFAADTTVSGVFNSRSFSVAATRPVLTVQAVPEPGTLALTALALTLTVRKLRGKSRR